MSTRGDLDRLELLHGTSELLLLRTPLPGPARGHAFKREEGAAENIRRASWERRAQAITGLLRAAGQEGRS